MPEGPEVKIIADILNREVSGFQLSSISYTENSRYARIGLSNSIELSSLLPLRINQITTKGKKIIFHLDDEVYLISSLMMEGKWTWTKNLKHSDLSLNLTKWLNRRVLLHKCLYFNDSRHFGTLEIILGKNQLNDRLKSVGPDLLSDDITFDQYYAKIKNKRLSNKKIGSFLMDQKYFSGIGNYLRAEILYATKISPHRLLSQLCDDEIRLLLETSKEIIRSAYDSHGFTLATYWDPHGRKGNFSVKIYGKSEDPYGNQVITETLDQRTVHWVPQIQT